jgi:hypothetical protein
MVGRQQKCNSDIVASVSTTTQGVTSGFGQQGEGASMEKNMLVDSFVLHEEASL